MEFDEEEMAEFKTEAFELLDSGEDHLLILEKGGDFRENYDAIFRVFHSLKGAAGMIGMEELKDHMHKVENTLTSYKEAISIPQAIVTFFLGATDAARTLLNGQGVDFDYSITEGRMGDAETDTKTESAAPNESAPESKTKTSNLGLIYIVDDEPDLVEYMKEVLENSGFEVKGFFAADELIESFRENLPDLVLSDISMPKMNGIEMLRAIRKINADVPLVFVSGFLSKDALLEAVENGVFGVIEKPINEKQLINYCMSATRAHKLSRLIEKSINFIMFQFSDLDDYLKQQGKIELSDTMRFQLDELLQQRRELRHLKK